MPTCCLFRRQVEHHCCCHAVHQDYARTDVRRGRHKQSHGVIVCPTRLSSCNVARATITGDSGPGAYLILGACRACIMPI